MAAKAVARDLVAKVSNSDCGNEPERSKRLKDAGYDPEAVRLAVNAYLRGESFGASKPAAEKAVSYRILKEGLWVWAAPKKGSRKLVQMRKGSVKAVTGTKEADGNLWASFVAQGAGKTRWFKIHSLDGKNVYAEKV